MKTNMQNRRTQPRTRRFFNHSITCALLALTAPLATRAEQTVFYDTFGTSSLNQTNIAGGIPSGLPTASQTSYTIGSAKNALATSITAGRLRLQTTATSSGNTEAQAVFTKYPVSLAAVGDYIEMTYSFTARYPILQATSASSTALFSGLFNSGGVAPQAGAQAAILQNGGFSSATTAAIGGVKQWVGFHAQMYNFTQGWRIYARPKQTAENNLNQVLLYNYPLTQGNGGSINPPSPDLIPGQQYTVQLRMTLSADSQLTVSNALYTGVDTSGAQFTNTSWVVTGANLVTTNFDSLAIGYRSGNPAAWTNDINYIKIVAGLAAQAGPYFSVTSSGDPCFGGVTVGLSGSVTTNDYLLYLNNVYAGTTIAGTGSALDFGIQSTPGLYTVVASNTVDASVGPMYGNANVFAPGVTIDTQPASVTLVSNLPTSFTVTATGASLTYQWYKNGVPLTNNANISGATTATLQIAAAGAADTATTINGYTVVAQTPCGNYATSAPPAALTLTQPRNLIWAGGVVGSDWNYTDQEFLLSGSPTAFAAGDNVTFNDSSANTSVTISNNLTPSLISVTGTASYTFGGPAKLTGISQLVQNSSGTLTIANDNDFTGGTVIGNGATLSLGDGTSVKGSVTGTATVSPSGTLNYSSLSAAASGTINIKNALAGSGTVNFNDGSGATFATPLALINSNFTGTINIQGFTRLHASDNNAGYAFGNGSTVNVPANTQAWLDRSATAYNNTFNIAGTGWIGVALPTGAMSIFGCTVTGPINLQADARIGGTINGGTIRSTISGPYELEVLGTTIANYVLQLGPTNGTHSYSSTLITAGTIQALNNNAISTGPLTIDNAGTLRLNGNNLSVSNLTSLNTGTVAGPGALVYNNHASATGVLTVGADNSSTAFDGVLGNGAAAALGLTKVGTGTLTLSGVNTNTGAVTVTDGTLALTGAGSFGNAALISVGSGAFYDVSAAGGTLTLNSGQTLGGSGTVNGNVIASAGSTIAPGSSVGTLTVAGNVSLGGGMTMELNRSLAPNSDRLAVSGGSITGGGSLTTTNIGPALQVGDTFQLFASGVSGITANLQTVDALNGVTYTWNNNLASSGAITVASVTPIGQPTLGVSQTGNSLTFSWSGPFKLQAQTNSLNIGISGNWGNYPGGSTSPVNVTINPANPTVFFRLSLQ
jgi:autotransporter-associated beta strand protein